MLLYFVSAYFILALFFGMTAALGIKDIPIPNFLDLPAIDVNDILGATVYEHDVRFILYTYSDDSSEFLVSNRSSIQNIDFSLKTVFLIHGWKGDMYTLAEIKDAFRKSVKKYNIIIVDWRNPASLDYISSVIKINSVGKIIAKAVDFLVNEGLNPKNINIIGYSLGAHVAGIAGFYISQKKVGEITGLDPAGPPFIVLPSRFRLDKSDGDFVQIIHTNAGIQGYPFDMGHADFYPNGGMKQAGCGIVDLTGCCSHRRSVDYYAESINTSVGFVGLRCISWFLYVLGLCSNNPAEIMGAHTSPSARGSYYLETNRKAPFSRG